MPNLLNKISKISIYFLVFLLPLFFLPWTVNVLEFNKQALMLTLVLISLICWLIAGLTVQRIEINHSFVNIAALILFFCTVLSTIFSLFRYGSFWGLPLPVASSLLSLLLLAIFYFLVTNIFKKEEIPFLALTLFLSVSLVAIFFILQVFGKPIFSFDFSQNTSFNTVGSPNSLAIYFSVLLVLFFPFFFQARGLFKVVLGIAGFLLLFCLFLINFQPAWLAFTIGLAVLLGLAIVSVTKEKKAASSSFIILLMIFAVIGLTFTIYRFSLPGLPTLALELSPSQGASFEIFKKLPLQSLFFGSGPGTFVYNWTKYKPIEINQSNFWQVRFSQAPSEILDRLITTGILGILALFFLVIVCLKETLGFLSAKKEVETLDLFLTGAILAGLVSLFIAFFFYPANLAILFLFWLLISFSVLFGKHQKKVLRFQINLTKALGVSFAAILILFFALGLAIFYGQKYIAEVKYYQGLRAWQQGEIEKSDSFITRAASLNPKMDWYWRDLAQVALFRVEQLLANADLNNPETVTQAQNLIAEAVNAATQATVVDPNNVMNWSIRGLIYQKMSGILGDAEEWAARSYQKAIELEPINPYFFTQLGQIYFTQNNLKLAREQFQKAIDLKSDYAPAHFQMAMTYIKEERTQDAIAKLEETKLLAPDDEGLVFQLGFLYYNNNQFDKAKVELERAVDLNSNYSNARYFLGLIYDREGKKEEAIYQFEKIEELNPDNEEVKKILTNLREGKAALEGVVPGQPPVEEKPAEQLEK